MAVLTEKECVEICKGFDFKPSKAAQLQPRYQLHSLTKRLVGIGGDTEAAKRDAQATATPIEECTQVEYCFLFEAGGYSHLINKVEKKK